MLAIMLFTTAMIIKGLDQGPLVLRRSQRSAARRKAVKPILDREPQFLETLNLRKIGPTARELGANFIIKPTVNG